MVFRTKFIILLKLEMMTKLKLNYWKIWSPHYFIISIHLKFNLSRSLIVLYLVLKYCEQHQISTFSSKYNHFWACLRKIHQISSCDIKEVLDNYFMVQFLSINSFTELIQLSTEVWVFILLCQRSVFFLLCLFSTSSDELFLSHLITYIDRFIQAKFSLILRSSNFL